MIECDGIMYIDNLIKDQTTHFIPTTEDGDVKIVWSGGHEGHVNLDWLMRHCYSHHSLEKRRKGSIPQLSKQVYI